MKWVKKCNLLDMLGVFGIPPTPHKFYFAAKLPLEKIREYIEKNVGSSLQDMDREQPVREVEIERKVMNGWIEAGTLQSF